VQRFFQRLLSLFRGERADAEVTREIAAHLALLEDEYRRRGMTPDEARLAARRALGSVAHAKDLHRDARSFIWLEDFHQDVKHAVRGLRDAPGFAVVAVLTVALGVGANIAIFGLVYQTLLRPLPFARPSELVKIATDLPQVADRFDSVPVTAPDFLEFRRSNTVFSGLAALAARDFNLTGSGEPERLHGARVSADLFSILGVRPERGRHFVAGEDEEGRDAVVIISHALWQRRFGSDPAIVNRTILLDGRPHAIVGVMPADLLFPVGRQFDRYITFGPRVDIWEPMAFTKAEREGEGDFNYGVIGRLKSDVSMAAARLQMDVLTERNLERIKKLAPADFKMFTRVTALHDVFTRESRRGLLFLEAAVGLLLLIACVNLANLLMARASNRDVEFAVRAALGAGRRRLVRQVLTESLVVTSLGGAFGVAFAAWTGPVLLAYGPSSAAAREWKLAAPMLAFAAMMTVTTALLSGLGPALRAGAVRARLRSGSRAVTGGLRQTLIAVEVALCTALLAVAGLLLHSFVNVTSVDAGFGIERMLAVDLSLPTREYTSARTEIFYGDLIARVRAQPGVDAVGAISLLPIAHEGVISTVLLDTDTQLRIDRPSAFRRSVTPGLFAAMQIPLRAGRTFADQEPAPVAIISEGLANSLWPGAALSSVVGRGIRRDPGDPVMRVVGIVGDVRADALDRDPHVTLYHPLGQDVRNGMTIVVRTKRDPLAAVSAVRAAVSDLDPDLPIAAIRTMRDVVSASLAERRFQMSLVTLLALLALVLAVVGIYGVTSYTVTRRTREIGLRVALGAQQGDVLRSVLVEGLRPVFVGLVLGVVGGQIGAQWIRAALFGIDPLDPAALGGVAGVLLLTATLACYLPARRAALVEPLTALRSE
jgi:putative ABC transport system permease protein